MIDECETIRMAKLAQRTVCFGRLLLLVAVRKVFVEACDNPSDMGPFRTIWCGLAIPRLEIG